MKKIYCPNCHSFQPFLVDKMWKGKRDRGAIWGDICCKTCLIVITSLEVDEPGIYEFVKVGELK